MYITSKKMFICVCVSVYWQLLEKFVEHLEVFKFGFGQTKIGSNVFEPQILDFFKIRFY